MKMDPDRPERTVAAGTTVETEEGGGAKLRVRQVLDQLRREARAVGYGTVGRVEKALGKHLGWLRQRRWVGSIELSRIFEALDFLELDPVAFFRKAFADEPDLELDRPRGEPPAIVDEAWRRLEVRTPGDMGRDKLDELDRLRYENPQLAAERAEQLVAHVELVHLPRLLGVVGSSYRLWNMRLDEAEHAIRAGLEIAQRQEDLGACGDLLQRLSYVVADRGEHEEALRIAEKAMRTYLLVHDMTGVGKALVDQGMFLFYLDRYWEAIRVTQGSLSYLQDEEKSNRLAALQYLGVFHQKVGSLKIAGDYAHSAETLVEGMDSLAKGKVMWLKATISTDLREYDQAEHYLKEVIEIFLTRHNGEAALASTELIRVQLLNGRPGEACQTAGTMYRLVEPLSKNPIVSSALADLLRVGLTGLTLELIEDVKAQLEKAKKHRNWRSLAI